MFSTINKVTELLKRKVADGNIVADKETIQKIEQLKEPREINSRPIGSLRDSKGVVEIEEFNRNKSNSLRSTYKEDLSNVTESNKGYSIFKDWKLYVSLSALACGIVVYFVYSGDSRPPSGGSNS